MSTGEWIGIAGAIGALLMPIAHFAGPVVAALISRRGQNNPTDQHGERWLLRVAKSPWVQSPWRLPPLVILLYLVLLIITSKPAIRYQFKTGQRDWPKT